MTRKEMTINRLERKLQKVEEVFNACPSISLKWDYLLHVKQYLERAIRYLGEPWIGPEWSWSSSVRDLLALRVSKRQLAAEVKRQSGITVRF
jgi:hypothetical protein